MEIRFVLAPTTGEERETIALDTATDLVQRLGAHLHGFNVRPHADDPVSVPSSIRARLSKKEFETLAGDIEKETGSAATLARKAFAAVCENKGLTIAKSPRPGAGASASWQEYRGSPHHIISITGRTADLIVIAQPDHGIDNNTGRFIRTAIFNTNTPLILVPPAWVRPVGRRILVGWDRGAEAMSAVKAGLHLLKEAEAVRIVSAEGSDKLGPNAQDLVRYLAWHGVEAEAENFMGLGEPQDRLLEEAKDFNADLIVMGAYSRSRFREFLFGGVTRSMLNQSEFPVLMQQ